MLNQLVDFKESLEKVVLAGAEEINELALELPTALGGSKATGYRNVISMEQEGIAILDHIIIGNSEYFSFRNKGLL